MYFDPLHSLSESARDDWQNPHRREQMVQEAQFEAHARMGKR
jgi:hypothetical protein